MITKEQVNNLPSEIGIYIFKKGNEILYVGKSINIKARVKSHIENARLDRKENLIIENSDTIEFTVVANEFESLILESQLIKKYRPKYNVIWRDGKSHLYVKVTVKDDYPKVLISRRENDHKSNYYGPFSSTRIVESMINDIRHIVPFCTEKNITSKPCFYSKINLCNPCPNLINRLENVEEKKQLKKVYRSNIKKVEKILKGGVTGILNELYKNLKILTNEKNYEDAIEIRNKIFRIERLMNHPTTGLERIETGVGLVVKQENDVKVFVSEMGKYFPGLKKLDRVECYDISNLGNKNQVGSMVVLTDGKIDKKQYRRFKIKNQKSRSDFERLREVIIRRFNNDWPIPDLLIVDGGRPQVKIVRNTLMELNANVPVLGIAKNPDRLVVGDDGFATIRFPQTNPAFNLIRLIRDESHRFAKKYHVFLRRRDFLV